MPLESSGEVLRAPVGPSSTVAAAVFGSQLRAFRVRGASAAEEQRNTGPRGTQARIVVTLVTRSGRPRRGPGASCRAGAGSTHGQEVCGPEVAGLGESDVVHRHAALGDLAPSLALRAREGRGQRLDHVDAVARAPLPTTTVGRWASRARSACSIELVGGRPEATRRRHHAVGHDRDRGRWRSPPRRGAAALPAARGPHRGRPPPHGPRPPAAA